MVFDDTGGPNFRNPKTMVVFKIEIRKGLQLLAQV